MVLPAVLHFNPVQFSLHKHSPVSVLQTLGLTVPSGLHLHSVIKVKIIDFKAEPFQPFLQKLFSTCYDCIHF